MGTIFSVFLSAGHGGSDPGAVSHGLKEKDINLQIMLACKSELERHGVKVICSRTTDENDPVAQEVNEANASRADIAVSFHTNAGGGDGSESFYFSTDARGKRLAELCEMHTKAIGQNSRGVKKGDHLWFIKKTNMTAVLCECGFVDNIRDNDIIDTVEEQQKFGIAYAKAILEYFRIDYISKSVVVPASSSAITTVKIDAAKKFDKKYAKDWSVVAKDYLTLRAGAGTDKAEILRINPGEMVKCYGYYSINGNTTWLYVVYKNKVGFVSKGYLI